MYRVTYGVYGEYEDYMTLDLTSKEYKVISKFLESFKDNVQNVSIHEISRRKLEN